MLPKNARILKMSPLTPEDFSTPISDRCSAVKRPDVFLRKGTACANPGCTTKATHLVNWCLTEESPLLDESSRYKRVSLVCLDSSGHLELMTIDHIRASSLGGSDHISNLQPMCFSCNNRKSSHEARLARKFHNSLNKKCVIVSKVGESK